MDFATYAAVYHVYTYWSKHPIRYTFSGYKTLAAAINDVGFVLKEIAAAEGFYAEDICVQIDYYEDTYFGSENIDYEDLDCYVDEYGIAYII